MSFYPPEEIAQLGLRSYGRQVLIDRRAVLIGAEWIALGDNVRIDAFCLLSSIGHAITLTGQNHIAAGTYIYANGGDVTFGLFAGASPGCRIFTATDDFTVGALRGPQIPQEFRKEQCGPVVLRENAGLATNSVVLPGCTIGVNATTGAGVVVQTDLPDHTLTYQQRKLMQHQKDADTYYELAARAKSVLHASGYAAP